MLCVEGSALDNEVGINMYFQSPRGGDKFLAFLGTSNS